MSGSEAFDLAYRRVVEGQYTSLFRYLNRLSGDRALAADVTQEAFIKLYERGALPHDTRAWLASVANNLVRDDHRRTVRRTRLLSSAAADEVRGTAPPMADVELEREERRTLVRKALEHLAERDRQLLLLRYEGLSYRELATALGLEVTSVGALLARAKVAFQAALERSTDASI
ncbi:MAG: RNA polymerase sigma factor SigX [Gemmatimonadaceae bacterium]